MFGQLPKNVCTHLFSCAIEKGGQNGACAVVPLLVYYYVNYSLSSQHSQSYQFFFQMAMHQLPGVMTVAHC